MEGHIYVYGEIGWQVDAKDIVNALSVNKEADTLIVHINSYGGDVFTGWSIYDILRNSGKKIITQVEGICASIASVIFLAGEERLMTENSQLMIHLPSGYADGTAEEMEKYISMLKIEETKLINFYSKITAIPLDEIEQLMKDETFFSTTTSIEKGFATGTSEQLKAVAKFSINQNNINNMDEQKMNGFLNKIESGFNKILQKFGFKNLILQDASGKNLDFGDQITEESQITVGMTAKYEDGTIPTGEITMPSGLILVFDETGTITEVKPVDEPKPNEEMEAMKAEIETLKAENAKLIDAQNSMKTEFKSAVDAAKLEFKNEMTKFIEENPEPQKNETENRFKNLKK